MQIHFNYKQSTVSQNNYIEVYANDAPIGTLSSTAAASEQLFWSPSDKVYRADFQFRNEDTFLSVVDELKRYKTEHGYRYLTIATFQSEYGDLLDIQLLKKAGFTHIPNKHSSFLFLE